MGTKARHFVDRSDAAVQKGPRRPQEGTTNYCLFSFYSPHNCINSQMLVAQLAMALVKNCSTEMVTANN